MNIETTPNGTSFAGRFAKFDPATVFESAGRSGMIDPSIRPAWSGAKLCGTVLTVKSAPGDNLMLHHAVAVAKPGTIIVADIGSYTLAGAWGEILTVAAKAVGVAGVVVNGAVRDIEAIAQHGFPVFSRGLAIGACTKERLGKLNVPLIFGDVMIRPGDIILGDSDGLVVIEREHADAVYQAAVSRSHHEQKIIAELQNGKTTIDILDLPKINDEENAWAK
jgi:4-hydroxy-4-methyl-2-oxoglutarate aldolase